MFNHRPAGGGGGPKAKGAVIFRKCIFVMYFSEMLLKYWEFRFETCHTSPGNNATPCVKIRTQVIIGQP